MPEPHLSLLCDFDLVSINHPVAKIIAADLDSGISVIPAELESKCEVSRLFLLPNEPVLSFGDAGAPDLTVADFPATGFSVPIREVLTVENRGEIFLSA